MFSSRLKITLSSKDASKIENGLPMGGFCSGRHKGDSASLPKTSSAIGVDVAAEDDDIGPPVWLISSSEEEGV